MNCKNCGTELNDDQKFCPNCGAKVIKERLTVKHIWNTFADEFFGWDNKYILTMRLMLVSPESVLRPYLNGTRKKFMPPFAYLAIGTAITILLFNQFIDDYMEMVKSIGNIEYDVVESNIESEAEMAAYNASKAESAERNIKIQRTILKFYNVITFLMVPLYAFIARIVFGKPFNYAEHLATVTFIQGTIFFFTVILFLLGVFVDPSIFSISAIVSFVYYLYVYRRLYELSFGKTIVKFLKFMGVLICLIFALAIVTFLIAYMIGGFGK